MRFSSSVIPLLRQVRISNISVQSHGVSRWSTPQTRRLCRHTNQCPISSAPRSTSHISIIGSRLVSYVDILVPQLVLPVYIYIIFSLLEGGKGRSGRLLSQRASASSSTSLCPLDYAIRLHHFRHTSMKSSGNSWTNSPQHTWTTLSSPVWHQSDPVPATTAFCSSCLKLSSGCTRTG